MGDIGNLIDLLETTAGSITVLTGGATASWLALRWIRRKVRAAIADIRGVHELIRYQLTPNSGKSVVDQVGKIEPLIAKVEANHQDAQKHWRSLEDGLGAVVHRIEKIEAAVATPKEVRDG